MTNFIRNVGENGCMPQGAIAYAEAYYEKIKRQVLPAIRSRETVAAYAIYEALNRYEVPRMAEEIEYYSGVKIADIFRVEANLTLEISLNNPRHYVQRYCRLLTLDYSFEARAKETVECMLTFLQLGNLRCNCLVAVAIYLLQRELKKKITLRKICEVCQISATSVHRVIRKLKSEHYQEIESASKLSWMLKHLIRII